MLMLRCGWPGVLLCLLASDCAQSSNSISGFVGSELRWFFQDAGQEGVEDYSFSLIARARYSSEISDGGSRFHINGVARYSAIDRGRNYFDFNDFYYHWRSSDFDFYAGLRTIFWGVTESEHLVDVINQRNNLEDIDGEDKLGQPMLQFSLLRTWGAIDAFILPYFREQAYPDEDSRLGFDLPVANKAAYESDEGSGNVDFALRWSHYIGIWDFGLSVFKGTARDPVFQALDQPEPQRVVEAFYRQIIQTGLEMQATLDRFLFKGEYIRKVYTDQSQQQAAVLGLEYTLHSFLERVGDLGLLIEFQKEIEGALPFSAQNDIVLGARYSFNDLDASEFLFLYQYDLDHHSSISSLELSRRLNDKWKIAVEGRVFSAGAGDRIIEAFENDDYLEIELRRYF